jgi:Single-strand binding protein family
MPDPSRKRPTNQARLLSRPMADERDRWPTSLTPPLAPALFRHATVSTVPRFQGQGRPSGQATGRGKGHDRGSRQLAGNLTDQPELRHTESGIARAMFRVAVSGRREQEPSFFTVIVWRD